MHNRPALKNLDINNIDILDQLPCNVYIYKGATELVWTNIQQRENLKGLSANKNLTYSIYDLMSQEEAEIIEENNKIVLTSQRKHTFNEKISWDNTINYYHSHKTPLYTQDNELYGVLGISHNVSNLLPTSMISEISFSENMESINQTIERYAEASWVPGSVARQSLERVREYIENIIGIIPGHFYWYDKKNTMLGCNQEQAASLGLTRDQVINKTIYTLMPPDQAKKIEQVNREVLENGVSVEEIEPGAQGKQYLTKKRPIYGKNGSLEGIMGVSLDITELSNTQKKLRDAVQMAEQANLAKTEFLLNMSHDIRTPCSGILGLSKILKDAEIDTDKKEKLGHIETSANKLLSMLSQIVDYIRDENDSKPTMRIFNLRALISGIKEILFAKIVASNLEFKINYSKKISDYWMGDANHLERILLNLITNAVKFTESGNVTLEVKDNNQQLEISVADTGCGIDKSNHKKIFEQFQRLTPSYSSNIEGTGLGLSLVKSILDNLKGYITVESEEGVGSKFTCTIPFKPILWERVMREQLLKPSPQTTNEDKQPTENFHTTKQKRGSAKVLVIEDDEISGKINRIVLEQNNYQVTECTSAEQAIGLKDIDFDLVITDIGLPGMNGFEFASNFRTRESVQERKNPAYIVGLSAHLGPRYQDLAEKSGMNKIITKPLTQEVLMNI